MIQYLSWASLEERRLRSRVTMMYQIVHGLVAIPLQRFSQTYSGILVHDTRGHSIKFLVPPVRVDAYCFSFFPATVTLWNNLPTAVVLSLSVDSFKNHVAAVRLTASTSWVYSFLFMAALCNRAGHVYFLDYTEVITVRRAVFIYSYTHVVCTWSLLPVPVLCSCSCFMFLLCVEHISWSRVHHGPCTMILISEHYRVHY